MKLRFLPASAIALSLLLIGLASAADKERRLVIVAGKPSHPPRMHEFNAGVQLMAKCLKGTSSLKTTFVLNGWPQDEELLKNADAIIFYMDGGRRHEVVQQGRRRLELVDGWAKQGKGLGFMHFGVEIVPDQAGDEFKRWIGGHYENMFSCNPIWEPAFEQFHRHPITRGVKPFSVKDEWYFNMRFVNNAAGNKTGALGELKFTPILVASPPESVRGGPYVYPKGPYKHIVANKGRAEAMMWAVERPGGGRGFGFTGGHFHDNWANGDYRKTVLNACLWLAGCEVPQDGVASTVTKAELDANLDPKRPRKKK